MVKRRRKRKSKRPKKRRRFATTSESKIIAASQGWRCNSCHELLTAFYEIDHIRPFSSGGDTSLKNMQALCTNCHREKTIMERLGRCPICLRDRHSKFFTCQNE